MDKLIKDIIKDTRVNNVLESNGFKYIGQLLIIHEHSLMARHRIGKEAINVIANALYSNRYGCIGSRQAHELPAIVLRHMADLAEAKERDEREKKDKFFKKYGCTLHEFIAKNIDSFGEDVN